jgi:hypothetical protein
MGAHFLNSTSRLFSATAAQCLNPYFMTIVVKRRMATIRRNPQQANLPMRWPRPLRYCDRGAALTGWLLLTPGIQFRS